MAMTRGMVGLLLAVVLSLPAAAAAQSERGTISGLVVDSTKAALPGVSVVITNTATNQAITAVTSESGAYSAANLAPGCYRVEASVDGFPPALDGISVNTNRNANTAETNFLTPSVEAITEFSVETNGFKPEFGQAGGGVVTFASKSGTNKFEGSVYNFLRDDALDEKPCFATTKGIYKQHNFGGSLGGPILLPGYNGRNRTFFFASYEGFVNKQSANGTFASVPTPEMLNGDFSNLVDRNGNRIVIYDPATTRPNPNGSGFIRDPFPGNIIPAGRFSAVAKQYLALARSALVPNQSAAPGTFGYINNNFKSESGFTKETTNKYSLKIDHTLTNRQRMSYLFNRSNDRVGPGDTGPVGLPAPFNAASLDTFDADLHRVTWDMTASHWVNHLTAGVNIFNKDSKSINVGGNL